MADRITELERLTRLRADGTLSEEEFEREKQRLLETRPRRLWIFAASGLALAVVAAALLILLPGREPVQQAARERPRRAEQKSEVRPVFSPLPGSAAASVDVSSTIGTSDGCRFAPELRTAFDNLLHYDEAANAVRPLPVEIGAMRLTPALTAAREEGIDEPGHRRYDSSVRFSGAVTWNGLRLTALRAQSGWEWSSQTMEFADSPERVRAALQRMGINVPAAPATLDLPTQGCSAAIGVEARGTGGALICSDGC